MMRDLQCRGTEWCEQQHVSVKSACGYCEKTTTTIWRDSLSNPAPDFSKNVGPKRRTFQARVVRVDVCAKCASASLKSVLSTVPGRCILIVAPQIVPKPEQRQTRFVLMPHIFFPHCRQAISQHSPWRKELQQLRPQPRVIQRIFLKDLLI